MASSDDAANKMKRIMEMLQLHAAKREDEDLPIVLQVYTREDQIRPEVAKKCKKWSDAAYAGDWDTIMSIADNVSHGYGEMANTTRLIPNNDSASSHRSSGYTVLHQAAYNNAPEDVVKALLALGSLRTLRSTDGQSQTPADIAASRGYTVLANILAPPNLIPHISDEALDKIQEHFSAVVLDEARRIYKPETMKMVDVRVMREVKRVFMPVPGMYGGFTLTWEGDHLISESYCRVCGGSGRTNHITAEGAKLVAEGWG